MQKKLVTILNTRPEIRNNDDSDFRTLYAPMLDIVAVKYEVPDISKYKALVFTSSRAVDNSIYMDDISVFAVGRRTEEALIAKGYKDILCADGNGNDLYKLILLKGYEKCQLLHIRGRDIAFDLANKLLVKKIILDSLIVYESNMVSSISKNIIKAIKLREIDMVSFYSLRSGQAFVNLIGKYGLESYLSSIKCLCFSDMVLNSVSNMGWDCTHVCEKPEEEYMIKLVRELS